MRSRIGGLVRLLVLTFVVLCASVIAPARAETSRVDWNVGPDGPPLPSAGLFDLHGLGGRLLIATAFVLLLVMAVIGLWFVRRRECRTD
jgi:hypothetical protein